MDVDPIDVAHLQSNNQYNPGDNMYDVSNFSTNSDFIENPTMSRYMKEFVSTGGASDQGSMDALCGTPRVKKRVAMTDMRDIHAISRIRGQQQVGNSMGDINPSVAMDSYNSNYVYRPNVNLPRFQLGHQNTIDHANLMYQMVEPRHHTGQIRHDQMEADYAYRATPFATQLVNGGTFASSMGGGDGGASNASFQETMQYDLERRRQRDISNVHLAFERNQRIAQRNTAFHPMAHQLEIPTQMTRTDGMTVSEDDRGEERSQTSRCQIHYPLEN